MKPKFTSMIWNIRKQKTTIQSRKKKKVQKNEDSVSSLWDNFKRSKIGMPEEEESKKL